MTADSIVITGAGGFVGRHLVSHLAAGRRRLVLAVRDARSCPAEWRDLQHVNLVETGPLETARDLERLMEEAQSIVHLAALAHVGNQSGAGFDAANAVATLRLCQAAKLAGIRRFIHLGSIAAVTGNAADAVINDDVPCAPDTAYGRSKLEAERHVAQLAQNGVFAVTLRPPLIVGADAKGNWGSLLKLAASGLPLPFASVRNRRSLLDVAHLVRAIELLATQDWPAELSGNYSIANRTPLSLPQMVAGLRQGMAKPDRMVSFAPGLLAGALKLAGRRRMADGLFGSLQVDGSRLNRTFGLAEQRGLSEAVREAGRLYAQLHSGQAGTA